MAVIRKIKLPSEAAARDIGALSSNVIYDGDSGITTPLNDKIQSIFTAIGNINSFEIAIVSTLPATGDDHTIYFVPESESSTTHNEYMYIDNQWELIGTTTIDLSDYVTETELATALTPYVQTSALTTTLDDRYVNTTGDTMSGTLTISFNNGYTGVRFKAPNSSTYTISDGDVLLRRGPAADGNTTPVLRVGGGERGQVNAIIRGLATPTSNTDATNKEYVDSAIAGISIPSISAASALTTGITTGTVTINGTTTTFYAPETPQRYDIIASFDANKQLQFENSNDTFGSIIEKIENGYDVYFCVDTYIRLNLNSYSIENGYINFSGFNIDSDITRISVYVNEDNSIEYIEIDYASGASLDEVANRIPDMPTVMNYYGVCSETGMARTLTVDSSFRLITGVEITVRFAKEVTGTSVNLNVNNTGAKQIVFTNNEGYTVVKNPVNSHNTWNSQSIVKLVYDGTHWVWINYPNKASTSEFGIVRVGDNIAIDDGVISINNSKIISALGYTPANVSSIPSITATAGLTTGVTIGSIDINGTTTTLYAPEDTKVKQNDITGSTTGMRPVLLSAQANNKGTIADESLKSDTLLFYKVSDSLIITRSSSDDFDGRFAVTDSAGRPQAEILSYKEGTTTQTGIGLISAGNNQPSGVAGNAKGALVIYGEGNWQNQLYALDNRTTDGNNHNYVNYLPMVDQAVLAAGATTGVGSSTVPVYMAAGGELLACTLPTPTTYTMSMTGPTINLLADGVAASTITLPVWDGTLD